MSNNPFGANQHPQAKPQQGYQQPYQQGYAPQQPVGAPMMPPPMATHDASLVYRFLGCCACCCSSGPRAMIKGMAISEAVLSFMILGSSLQMLHLCVVALQKLADIKPTHNKLTIIGYSKQPTEAELIAQITAFVQILTSVIIFFCIVNGASFVFGIIIAVVSGKQQPKIGLIKLGGFIFGLSNSVKFTICTVGEVMGFGFFTLGAKVAKDATDQAQQVIGGVFIAIGTLLIAISSPMFFTSLGQLCNMCRYCRATAALSQNNAEDYADANMSYALNN